MKLKEYKDASNVTGIWSFLTWFICTKEFKWVLGAIILILIWNPEFIVAIRQKLVDLIK
jgi:hypothetical protein